MGMGTMAPAPAPMMEPPQPQGNGVSRGQFSLGEACHENPQRELLTAVILTIVCIAHGVEVLSIAA